MESKSIYQEIRGEDVGIWFISDEFGFKVSVKIPANVIRSLIKGCEFRFFFGKDKNRDNTFFHSGAKVYDDKTNPIIITQPTRFIHEYKGLQKVLSEEEIIIEFYDELAALTATATLEIEKSERDEIFTFLGDINDLYVGEYNQSLSLSMDSFVYTLDASQKTKNSSIIGMKSMNCKISNWKGVTWHFVGSGEGQIVNITDENEGGILEKQIWFSMENLFLENILLNPEVHEESKPRELTDIFAYYKLGIFLIETKALGVFKIDKEQTLNRKVANVQKQVSKGINQLIGATKNIKRGLLISNKSGKVAKFDNSLIPHCIVLVSELLPFGDWSKIEKRILTVMMKEKIYLHVMDFNEFVKFLKVSKGIKEHLDYYLMGRAEKFIEIGNIHMKHTFVNKS